MGTKLSPKDLALYNYVDEVLYNKWDPIGVCFDPAARTEYRAYLPEVFSLLKQSKTADEIADFLVDIQDDRMGLPVSRQGRKKIIEIAQMLIDYKANLGV
ncbi:hypothetical protein ACJVC5_10885 [Peredibacter sp. HCB2-198]|uniref:hypothetical protein n=1 Tax=Peredibacter sp. HCB2-198 TaxID=3383025 RepID=UPI0038B5F989